MAKLFPDNFIGAAMLPQSPGVDPKTCIPELERCVKEFGFVGINLNPDPSGGWWTSPPLTDRHWYPIYEKMVENDIPAMVHVSTSCNPCSSMRRRALHQHINADTTAVMQLIQGDLFEGRCHANLNLRREVRKSQLGLMLPSRLATSGTLRL